LPDQVLGATVQGLPYLGAEAATAERDGLSGNRLPVEPRCAGCRDLLFDREIRADRERDTAPALASSNLRSSTIEPGALSRRRRDRAA